MKPNLFGRFVRATVGKLLPIAFSTKVTGAENFPAGGAILAGNHVSYMDPMLLWSVSPRPVHFMAKRELWEEPIIRWALPRLWAFPVNRGEPDRTAITTATDLLNSGEMVGVFPEGSRSQEGATELSLAHGGAAFIALRANVPIVPIAFAGTERVWPRGRRFPRLARTAIRIGAPVLPSEVLPGAHRRERVDALTAVVMQRIAEELELARRAAS